MKHIETFESFSTKEVEKIDEGLIKNILMFPINLIIGVPLAAIILITTQFLNPRHLKGALVDSYIDIYDNIDILIDTLENIHFNKADITDVESRKILKRLNELKKVKQKWPTLDDYKKNLSKYLPYLNIKNRGYLKDQIMKYEPKKLTAEQVLKEIQKVYKLATQDDIIGEPAARDVNWRDMVGNLNLRPNHRR